MTEKYTGIVTDSGMPRLCIRLEDSQLDKIEQLISEGKFPNRSEAIREAIRRKESKS